MYHRLSRTNQERLLVQQSLWALRLRHILALAITTMFLGWLLFGLILLALQGNGWILVSSLVLAYPMHRIICYYFALRAGLRSCMQSRTCLP